MTEFACQAARHFISAVNDYSLSRLQENITKMHQIEHNADKERHEIMRHLAKEFLPPIEREDIAELAYTIDDVTDSIDDILQHFYLYDVQKLIPECVEFSKLILQCCESVLKIAEEFGSFHKSTSIHDYIVETNHLESQGDILYQKAMRRIFTSGMTDKEVVVWARLITSFEECCDYCEDVSDLFESAIMKNS
jgi:predicted phosphate transport protein (TIGR00153 family)